MINMDGNMNSRSFSLKTDFDFPFGNQFLVVKRLKTIVRTYKGSESSITKSR